MDLNKLSKINKESISAAGPRYSPVIDPNAPNIKIEALVNEIDALSLSDRYRKLIFSYEENVGSTWKKTSRNIKTIFSEKENPTQLVKLLSCLKKQGAGKSESTIVSIKKVSEQLILKLNKKQDQLFEQEKQLEENSEPWRLIQSEISETRKLISSLRQVTNFANSTSAKLLVNNKLLILGQWGMGKTHFLCDITKDRVKEKLPTLFLLAHQLPPTEFFSAICKFTNLAKNSNALLRKMNALGRDAKGRALIIVDGINEADKAIWRRDIQNISDEVDKYPNVAIILSCRTPFDKQIFNSRSRKYFTETFHTGFQDAEFDAQRAFFQYYNIPTPNIPLLTPEFTRPLFLKILCLTFSGRTSSVKSRWIREISMGQRGMTKIFEDFVNFIGSKIEREFSLPHKTCWRILKGQKLPNGEIVGVAVSMMTEVKDYISLRECLCIIKQVSGLQKQSEVKKLFNKLILEGLLIEDTIWQNGGNVQVIRLPYQRFGDHLIARHLIDNYLNTHSENSIRQSFYANRPLGKIFNVERSGYSYNMPGLASAIMIDFPERVKRALPLAERELVFYLPKNRRLLMPLVDVFLEGILWRSKDSFSMHTDRIIGTFLSNSSERIVGMTFEALITLACRPGHSYSARKLYEYLAKKQLAERDLLWSEFIRNSHEESVIFRIIEWLESSGVNGIRENVAENVVLLLSLFLTTTRRAFRDRVTKILVLIGDKHPQAVFNTTIQTLSFNDPYVSERMLAACYGISMHNWAFPTETIKRLLPEFACKIYDNLFALDSPHKTKHILSRDYALGIIELARKVNKSCLANRSLENLKPPFQDVSNIPDPNKIDEEFCKLADGALRMDFENYTVGRLVSGRRNYDSEHNEYKEVLKQIKWRILDLGYNADKFSSLDRQISSRSFYDEQKGGEPQKTDRYGKKYSWIAFFEVAGLRSDLGLLSERYSTRISDCDIDPSFPEDLKIWEPPLSKYFTNKFTSPRSWVLHGKFPEYDNLLKINDVDGISGEWVLLNGYIQESALSDPRRMFTFLKCVLVDSKHIPKLRTRFSKREYPGNYYIPDAPNEYYTFAGEIPWSNKYGADFYLPGKTRRNIQKGFEERKDYTVRKKVVDLSEDEKFSVAMKSVSVSSMLELPAKSIDDEVTKNLSAFPKYIEIPQFKIIPGISIEIPIHQMSWEDYHSSENQSGGADYLAPALCDFLKLYNKSNFQDLFDENNKQATIFRTFGDKDSFSRSTLMYVRTDLFKKYLSFTNQKLVWFIWGERDFEYKSIEKMRAEVEDVWDHHGHIFRKMIVARI